MSFWWKCMSKYNFIMLTWKKCVCENAIIVTKCYCILCLNIIYFLLGFFQQISILSCCLFSFKHGNKVIFYAFTNRNAFNGRILFIVYESYFNNISKNRYRLFCYFSIEKVNNLFFLCIVRTYGKFRIRRYSLFHNENSVYIL